MSQLFSGKDNVSNASILVCSETCQRHVPTLWRYRFGRLIQPLIKKSFYHQVFFRCETASGFYPWGKKIAPIGFGVQ